jgi:hypothetical protein
MQRDPMFRRVGSGRLRDQGNERGAADADEKPEIDRAAGPDRRVDRRVGGEFAGTGDPGRAPMESSTEPPTG